MWIARAKMSKGLAQVESLFAEPDEAVTRVAGLSRLSDRRWSTSVAETQPVRDRLRRGHIRDWHAAGPEHVSLEKYARMERAEEAAAVAVDDSSAEELAPQVSPN